MSHIILDCCALINGTAICRWRQAPVAALVRLNGGRGQSKTSNYCVYRAVMWTLTVLGGVGEVLDLKSPIKPTGFLVQRQTGCLHCLYDH